jgi:hypothetical protein
MELKRKETQDMKKQSKILAVALVAFAFIAGVTVLADVVTNRGEVITVTTMGESTKVVDQAYLGGAVRLTDTDAAAPTMGFLTIRGTNLVFITTMKDGVAVSRDTAYVVVKAGVLP